MIGAAEFESTLRAFCEAPVGAAAARDARGVADWFAEGFELERDLLRDALDRLRQDPGILSGDPDGTYTFEDPVLAVAADFVRRAQAAPVSAAGDGGDLRARSWWQWALAGVRAWQSRGGHAWGALGGRTPTRALEIPHLPARIAIVGDAGYAGVPQARVLAAIAARHRETPFDLGVHLGDTYFAGSEAETLTNLLKPLAGLSFPFTSLCGNHDLYYGPAGYSATISILRQPGRYFAVDAPSWRIACLDTSLACERVLRNDGKLDEGQLGWLDDLLQKEDGKRLLLMSHHYIVSDWGSPMGSLHAQMRDRLRDRALAWYWGHEHSAVAYGRTELGFYGACVGNGAFLEKRTPARPGANAASWIADGECACYPSRTGFWPHGWLELELRADELEERYHLEGRGMVHSRKLPRLS